MANPSSARFRTPISRARGLGASHHGVGHFITERVSGIALIHLKGAVQVVIEDYIPDFTTKTVLVLANLFVCVLGGALGVVAILKVAFTGAF